MFFTHVMQETDVRTLTSPFDSYFYVICYNVNKECGVLHAYKYLGTNLTLYYFDTTDLTLSDPTSDLVRQYDFPVLLQCRKTSDAVFVAFVRPLSEPVRRFSSCSMDISQQISQVVLFLFLHVFLF
jgi:hypothetical protein